MGGKPPRVWKRGSETRTEWDMCGVAPALCGIPHVGDGADRLIEALELVDRLTRHDHRRENASASRGSP